MPKKYPPFTDKAHMLRSALADAIAWEESRMDAGCPHISGPQEVKATEDRIAAYRKELYRMNPDSKTQREVMDDEFKTWKAVPIMSFKTNRKKK